MHSNFFRCLEFDDQLVCAISKRHASLAGFLPSTMIITRETRIDLMKCSLQDSGFERTATQFSECVNTDPESGCIRLCIPGTKLWSHFCKVFGGFSCHLLALIVTVILIGIPFRYLMCQDVLGNRRPRGLLFWPTLAAAAAFSVFLLWSALKSNYLYPGLAEAASNDEQLANQRAFMIGIGLFVACMVALHWLTARWAWICRGLVAAGCVAYLVCVCAAAFSRHALSVLLQHEVIG